MTPINPQDDYTIIEVVRLLNRMEASSERRFADLERKIDAAVFVPQRVYEADQRRIEDKILQLAKVDERQEKKQEEQTKTVKAVALAVLGAVLAVIGNYWLFFATRA